MKLNLDFTLIIELRIIFLLSSNICESQRISIGHESIDDGNNS